MRPWRFASTLPNSVRAFEDFWNGFEDGGCRCIARRVECGDDPGTKELLSAGLGAASAELRLSREGDSSLRSGLAGFSGWYRQYPPRAAGRHRAH